MSTHTAIATTTKGQFDAIRVPTEAPGQGEILLKVEYSSMVAFDTYMTDMGYAVASYPMVLGLNASGTVAKLGPGVDDLEEGDRVRTLESAWVRRCSFRPLIRSLLFLTVRPVPRVCRNTLFCLVLCAQRYDACAIPPSRCVSTA
jgi:threonine dehydrogenase-like Zn-dependent dehydrogenase